MGNSSSTEEQKLIKQFRRSDWVRLSDQGMFEIWKNKTTGQLAEAYLLDDEPNEKDMEHYHFRHFQHKYLVGVIGIDIQKQKTLCTHGQAYVLTEYLPLKLEEIDSLTVSEGLMILKAAYSAFNTMSAFYSPFIPSEQLIGFNVSGEPKIWLNKNHSKNEAARILKAQIWEKHEGQISENVRVILEMVEERLSQKHFARNFRETFYNNNLNFFEASNFVEEYCEKEKIGTPDSLFISRFISDPETAQMVKNWQQANSKVEPFVFSEKIESRKLSGTSNNILHFEELSRKGTFDSQQNRMAPENQRTVPQIHRVQTVPAFKFGQAQPFGSRVLSPPLPNNAVERQSLHSISAQKVLINNQTPLHVGLHHGRFASPGRVTEFQELVFKAKNSQNRPPVEAAQSSDPIEVSYNREPSDNKSEIKSIHEKIKEVYTQNDTRHHQRPTSMHEQLNDRLQKSNSEDQLNRYISSDSYHQKLASSANEQLEEPQWQKQLLTEEPIIGQYEYQLKKIDSLHGSLRKESVPKGKQDDQEKIITHQNHQNEGEDEQNGYQEYRQAMRRAYEQKNHPQSHEGPQSLQQEQKVNSEHAIDINRESAIERSVRNDGLEVPESIEVIKNLQEQNSDLQSPNNYQPSIIRHQSNLNSEYSSQVNSHLNSQNHSRNPSKVHPEASVSERNRPKQVSSEEFVLLQRRQKESHGTMVVHDSRENTYPNIPTEAMIEKQSEQQIYASEQQQGTKDSEPNTNEQTHKGEVFHIRNESDELFQYTNVESIYRNSSLRQQSSVEEIVKLQRHEDIEEYIRNKYSKIIQPASNPHPNFTDKLKSDSDIYQKENKVNSRENIRSNDHRTMTFAKAHSNRNEQMQEGYTEGAKQEDFLYQNVESKYERIIVSNSQVRNSEQSQNNFGSNVGHKLEKKESLKQNPFKNLIEGNDNQVRQSNIEGEDAEFLDVKNLEKSLDQRYSKTEIVTEQCQIRGSQKSQMSEEDGFNVASLQQKLQKFEQSRQSNNPSKVQDRKSNQDPDVIDFQGSDNIVELMERKILESQSIKNNSQVRQEEEPLRNVDLMASISNQQIGINNFPILKEDGISVSNNGSNSTSKRDYRHDYGVDSEDFATGRESKPFNFQASQRAAEDASKDSYKSSNRSNQNQRKLNQRSSYRGNGSRSNWLGSTDKNYYHTKSSNTLPYTNSNTYTHRKSERRSSKYIESNGRAAVDNISSKYDKYVANTRKSAKSGLGIEDISSISSNPFSKKNYVEDFSFPAQSSVTSKRTNGKAERKTQYYLNPIGQLEQSSPKPGASRKNSGLVAESESQQYIRSNGSNKRILQEPDLNTKKNSGKISYDELRNLLWN